jgi:glutamyl-tRNA synthetase
VPLVLGPDGARLAKRHGATSLRQLAAEGIDAARVLRLLAQSLHLDVDRPVRVAADLLDGFERARVPREDVRIDPALLVQVTDWRSLRAEDRPDL